MMFENWHVDIEVFWSANIADALILWSYSLVGGNKAVESKHFLIIVVCWPVKSQRIMQCTYFATCTSVSVSDWQIFCFQQQNLERASGNQSWILGSLFLSHDSQIVLGFKSNESPCSWPAASSMHAACSQAAAPPLKSESLPAELQRNVLFNRFLPKCWSKHWTTTLAHWNLCSRSPHASMLITRGTLTTLGILNQKTRKLIIQAYYFHPGFHKDNRRERNTKFSSKTFQAETKNSTWCGNTAAKPRSGANAVRYKAFTWSGLPASKITCGSMFWIQYV